MTDRELLRQVQDRIAEEQQEQSPSGERQADRNALPVPTHDFVERCLYANELGDGLLLAYLFRGRHAYVGQADEWIYWSGHHWSVDLIEKGHHARADVEHVALAYQETARHFDALAKSAEHDGDRESATRLKAKADKMKVRVAKLRTDPGRKRCLEFAKTNLESPLAIAGHEIDRDPWALPMANGVVDLRTGELHPGRPEDWLVKSSPVEWQGIDAPCPHWERFVTEIMGDDPEMAAFLRRVFGYGCTGLAREHIFLVLFGRGRNGKGIMTEVIQTVLGGQNATASLAGPVQSEMLLDQGKNRSAAGPSPDIMSLRGLCIAFASETDEGQRAGARGMPFWAQTYRTARRWPVPSGKDPGDAVREGWNIVDWLRIGLPPVFARTAPQSADDTPSRALPPEREQARETMPAGQNDDQGGGTEKACPAQPLPPEDRQCPAVTAAVWGRGGAQCLTHPIGPLDSLKVLARAGLRAIPTPDGDFRLTGHEHWPHDDLPQLVSWLKRHGEWVRGALYGEWTY